MQQRDRKRPRRRHRMIQRSRLILMLTNKAPSHSPTQRRLKLLVLYPNTGYCPKSSSPNQLDHFPKKSRSFQILVLSPWVFTIVLSFLCP